MKHKILLVPSLTVLLFVVAVVIFALRIRDGDPRSSTLFDLRVIAQCVVELHNRGMDISKFESLHEFIAFAVQEQLLVDTEQRKLNHDDWQRRLHWKIQKDADEVIVIIQSDGRNAIAEDGKGDDLSVVITLPRRGQPIIELIPPK